MGSDKTCHGLLSRSYLYLLVLPRFQIYKLILHWYITDKNDRSKFSAYLPSDKTSIREKLEQNKERATDQNKSDRKMPERSKDDHERA